MSGLLQPLQLVGQSVGESASDHLKPFYYIWSQRGAATKTSLRPNRPCNLLRRPVADLLATTLQPLQPPEILVARNRLQAMCDAQAGAFLIYCRGEINNNDKFIILVEWLSEYVISITTLLLLVLASSVFCNIKGSWAEYHRFYSAWYHWWSINNLTSGRYWWSNAWNKNLTLNKTGDYSGHDQVIGRFN